MVDLIKNKNGVSQILGFVLSLSLTSAVVMSAGFLTSSYVDENTRLAAQTQAENIANQVVNLLVNAYIIKQQYPNASYNTSIAIPTKLVNHYYYSIKVDNNGVQVKSSDNRIRVTKTYFDVSGILQMDVKGGIGGSVGKITVRCDQTHHVYKYDFGPLGSDLVEGYERKTESDSDFTTGNPSSDSRGGSELGQDFVHDNSPATFRISGLTPGDPYSLTFSVGDKQAPLVDNMYITITGGNKGITADNVLTVIGPITLLDLNEPYTKIWKSNIYPKSTGELDIEFSDYDNDKWTICGMTVEEGERTIIVEGGD